MSDHVSHRVRGIRLKIAAAVGLVAAICIVPAIGTASASTPLGKTAPLVVQTVDAAPPIPGAGASVSTWQNFASQWDAALTSGASSITWQGKPCPVSSMTVVPLSSATEQVAGIPSGVSIDGFSFNLDCAIMSATSTPLESQPNGI